ncbi:MAG: peptide/nickel transport system permease protein [Nocardioidaceae bacterium]|jgi:peptide/nickel transport system permease protein|nr:peptide/nickel transport system permease protein [Nocardioidaceae bacterium]
MTLADVELVRPETFAVSERDETSNRTRQTAHALLRRPGFLLAVTYVVLVVLSAIAPRLFTSGDPTQTVPRDKFLAPSLSHLFGTDELGRDLFTRMVHGSALSIEATAIAVGVAVVAGLTIGVVSGYAGGWADSLLMRFVDVLLAIPALLLALAIVTALGFGTVNVAIAVGVGLTPGFARVTRAEVLRVKTLPYVEAARSSGARPLRVLRRHILPNSWGPVAVLAVLDFGTAILAVSSLSFLGFGAPPPEAEWGSLVAAGRTYLVTSPWLTLLPGLAVGAAVYALNHIGKTFEELQRWH